MIKTSVSGYQETARIFSKIKVFFSHHSHV